MAGRSSGKVTSHNVRQGEAPSARAACSTRVSRLSQAPPTTRKIMVVL